MDQIEIDFLSLSLASRARVVANLSFSLLFYLENEKKKRKKGRNGNEPVSRKTNSRVTMGTWPETAIRNSPGGK